MKTIEGLSDAAAQEIAYTAALVALAPSAKRPAYSSAAYVPWSFIEELRQKFTDAGVDWSKAKAFMDRRAKIDKLERQQQHSSLTAAQERELNRLREAEGRA